MTAGEARQRVHRALTADFGTSSGRETREAINCIELDGVLQVDHVDRFIAALKRWKNAIDTRNLDVQVHNRIREIQEQSA